MWGCNWISRCVTKGIVNVKLFYLCFMFRKRRSRVNRIMRITFVREYIMNGQETKIGSFFGLYYFFHQTASEETNIVRMFPARLKGRAKERERWISKFQYILKSRKITRRPVVESFIPLTAHSGRAFVINAARVDTPSVRACGFTCDLWFRGKRVLLPEFLRTVTRNPL